MLKDTTLVGVANISDGPVVYNIKELNVRREFHIGETKQIAAKELRALNYSHGGAILLRDFLAIDNKELLNEFNIKPEVEYSWTAADVKNLLLNAPLARLQDALDFAPAGIVSMIESMAISLEIPDMSKREAIKAKTGQDITKSIEINHITNEPEKVEVEEAKPAPKPAMVKTPTRRVSAE